MPTPGGYRLFLDFQHDGVVRTAEFTVRSRGQDPSGTGAADAHDDPHGEEGSDDR